MNNLFSRGPPSHWAEGVKLAHFNIIFWGLWKKSEWVTQDVLWRYEKLLYSRLPVILHFSSQIQCLQPSFTNNAWLLSTKSVKFNQQNYNDTKRPFEKLCLIECFQFHLFTVLKKSYFLLFWTFYILMQMQTVTPLHKLIKLNVAILIFWKNKYWIRLILLLLGIYRPQQILYFKPTAVFNLLTSVLCVNCVRNSHSLDIPTAKHFCRRQYWQRFRVTLLIMQFLSRWHVYTMFFWMLRRKKPCRDRYI